MSTPADQTQDACWQWQFVKSIHCLHVLWYNPSKSQTERENMTHSREFWRCCCLKASLPKVWNFRGVAREWACRGVRAAPGWEAKVDILAKDVVWTGFSTLCSHCLFKKIVIYKYSYYWLSGNNIGLQVPLHSGITPQTQHGDISSHWWTP